MLIRRNVLDADWPVSTSTCHTREHDVINQLFAQLTAKVIGYLLSVRSIVGMALRNDTLKCLLFGSLKRNRILKIYSFRFATSFCGVHPFPLVCQYLPRVSRGLTSHSTLYRPFRGGGFYRSDDPTNSVKALKEASCQLLR